MVNDPRVQRLRDLVEVEALHEGNFILSSGQVSPYLFQLNQVSLHPEGASIIGELVLEFMQRYGLRCVGGMEVGAIPIVTATAVVSQQQGYPVSTFFVRKARKDHGVQKRVEGVILKGENVLVIDDVSTTGQSILTVAKVVEENQGHVRTALSIIDRGDGAANYLAQKGVNLLSFLHRSDFSLPNPVDKS